MTQVASSPELDEKRHQWESLLRELAEQIERWCAARQWAVVRHVNRIDEPGLGEYNATTLHIHTGKGAMIVEPVARNIVGADGRVNLYNLGDFRRLALVRRDEKWEVFTEDRVPWPNPWNETTFAQVAEALSTP